MFCQIKNYINCTNISVFFNHLVLVLGAEPEVSLPGILDPPVERQAIQTMQIALRSLTTWGRMDFSGLDFSLFSCPTRRNLIHMRRNETGTVSRKSHRNPNKTREDSLPLSRKSTVEMNVTKEGERTTDQDPAFFFCTVAVSLFGFLYDATGCTVNVSS